jgi:hypothetical protein
MGVDYLNNPALEFLLRTFGHSSRKEGGFFSWGQILRPKNPAMAIGADGGVWKPLEIRLLAAFCLRRSLLAVAVQGHRVGHAALDDDDAPFSSA